MKVYSDGVQWQCKMTVYRDSVSWHFAMKLYSEKVMWKEVITFFVTVQWSTMFVSVSQSAVEVKCILFSVHQYSMWNTLVFTSIGIGIVIIMFDYLYEA